MVLRETTVDALDSQTDDFKYFMMINTIGMSILIDSIKSASRLFIYSNGYTIPPYKLPSRMLSQRLKECKQSFMFIQGTGLDMIINQYHLGYDPDHLRTCFNHIFNIRNGND